MIIGMDTDDYRIDGVSIGKNGFGQSGEEFEE